MNTTATKTLATKSSEGPLYAGGQQSPLARADGQGALLAKGWWIRVDGDLKGPFTTARRAATAAKTYTTRQQ